MKRLTIQIIIISIAVAVLMGACSVKKQATTESRDHIAYSDTPRYDMFFKKRTPYYYPSLIYKSNISISQPKVTTTQEHFEYAYQELEAMLQGKQEMNFERAVFISENSFYNNSVKYEDFQKVLDRHTERIKKMIAANDKSASMDFRTLANAREKGEGYSSLRYTEQEKKELYRKALTNWAIFTYLTDTIKFAGKEHLPFKYKTDDPFGMSNWGNSQVMHLLGSVDRQGNCFALVALFKILSNRLNSEAYICTAPQHIYIQHKDAKGQFYNLELATGTYPGDGTLQTLTFTYREGIMSGISLRRLKSEKQNIALCMVNLGKSYEHKFQDKQNDYLLKCAEAALQADSLNLNAMLLQKQVFEERVVTYLKQNNIEDIAGITKGDSIYSTYLTVQKQILNLYDLGYHEMPRYMQEIVLASFRKTNQPLYVSDRTPNPFTSIDVPKKDRRYSTISGGLYEEVHEKKEFEQYGQFIINTKERRIVKFEPNYLNLLIDPVVFAWSVDPMAHMRESWTPYNAFRNNPILNIDPTGALDTEYKDEEGNTLANTNDGNNSTVVVKNDKRAEFDKWKAESTAKGTLNNPENNMDMIHNLTPATQGVYFTSASYGMAYITRFSNKERKEYSGYLLKDGFYADATKGFDVRFKKNFENSVEDAGVYTAASNGQLKLGNSVHGVLAWVHSHPRGEFWSGLIRHKGILSEHYPSGDFQAFQGRYFKETAGINKFYLIQGNTRLRMMQFDWKNNTFTERDLGELNPYLNGKKKLY